MKCNIHDVMHALTADTNSLLHMAWRLQPRRLSDPLIQLSYVYLYES